MIQFVTVITPTPQLLTTPEALRAELGDEATGVSDADLERHIAAASAAASTYCHRVFLAEDVEETFITEAYPFDMAVRSTALTLERTPVVAITSVVEDEVELASEAYIADKSSGLLYRRIGVRNRWSFGQLVIAYRGGYEEVPADVEMAVILMGKLSFRSRRDPLIRAEEQPGVYSVTYAIDSPQGRRALPGDISDLLDPYRELMLA